MYVFTYSIFCRISAHETNYNACIIWINIKNIKLNLSYRLKDLSDYIKIQSFKVKYLSMTDSSQNPPTEHKFKKFGTWDFLSDLMTSTPLLF